MIKTSEQLTTDIRVNMLGGKGSVESTPLLAPEEFCGKGRVFNKIVLKPGCSIGEHLHSGEIEAYYVMEGEGIYYDNGKPLPVKAGELTYVYDGNTHGIENTGTTDMLIIALVLFTK